MATTAQKLTGIEIRNSELRSRATATVSGTGITGGGSGYAALLAHAGGVLYGMELGSVTLKINTQNTHWKRPPVFYHDPFEQ